MRPLLLSLFVTVGSSVASAQDDDALRITSITPSGTEVPPGRQIVFQFDRPVVPVGRMERTALEIPIRIDPPLRCEWRWLDTSALACQLGEDDALKPATHYTISVQPGITSEDGATLPDVVEHSFETERPRITRTRFRTWQGPGWPEFRATFNQRVTQESVETHLSFIAGGREVAVQAKLENPDAPEPERHWWLSPVHELPLDTRVHLKVEPGLVSLEGELPSTEDENAVTFYTFPKQKFVGVQCMHGRELVRILPTDDPRGRPLCDPMSPVALVFASPIIKDVLREHLQVDPDLAGGREDYDPWDRYYGYTRLHQARRADQEYIVSLPELLRADTAYRISADASRLLDEFGRPLSEDVDFYFATDNRPPKAVLTHPSSTLEKDVDTHVPIVVTNLDALSIQVRARTAGGIQTLSKSITLSDVENVAYRVPLEVREWLDGASGVLFGDVTTTPRLGDGPPDRFFTQVTPFAVHVKMGHQNTAVWVTDMATGAPVPDARVSLHQSVPRNAVDELAVLTESTTGDDGVALLDGAAIVNPDLGTGRWSSMQTIEHGSPIFLVGVTKGEDIALAPLNYDYWVRPEGANNTWVPTQSQTRYGHVRAWGTTAQGVYRLGDTIQFKLYVRDQDNERFIPAPRKSYHLRVHDPMDKLVHETKNVELNDFGAYDGEFRIADSGAVGWYRFQLDADFHHSSFWPLQVLVADFTPAPFRVTTDLEGQRFEPGDELRVQTSAKLHAGGPYADADARITVRLAGTAVTTQNPKAQGFRFGGGSTPPNTVHQVESTVDRQGELASSFVLPDEPLVRANLIVESAVRDDRGKYVAGSARAGYFGRDRFIGIHYDGWLLEAGEPTEVRAIVLDTEDAVVPGVDITFRIQRRETTASRVKGAGNAYVTQYNHRWVDVETCTVASADDPVPCAFTPDRPGRYNLSASIVDTKGRSNEVVLSRWARGPGRVLWEGPPTHTLDIEAEKNEYRVGDTARFLIRNPFPGALALLTTERYGVQHHWLETLEDSTAVIEVDITEDHVPGFYFSATVTSPRVEAPLGEGDVDLGKPAFRMGYVQVPVKDPVKEMIVNVIPASDLYKPRDTVRVELEARPRLWAGATLPPMEIAVAVLDEAVFDLIGGGKSYFDPYEGFYSLEPLDVDNYNLLTRLIGIQKFEKKGANAGGGGGGFDMRSLFKFVSYWNPSVVPDQDGKATIEFEVPDNLTGWRVLAMAVTHGDRMGLGQGTFIVNKPTEIRPAIPNQITEGDRFDARFTVMNRTEEIRTLTVSASVDGPADSPGLAELTIEAEPYQRYPVSFPVRATSDGALTFSIRAGDLVDGDALRLPLPVSKRSAIEVAATYGTTTDPNTVEAFLFPENMRTDVGRVSLVASPTVLGNVEGAFDYLRRYPYVCWEQRLTKAVMASHFAELKGYVADDFTWTGHEELPVRTLEQAANFQAPNGGMVYWVPDDRYVSPYLSAFTALAFHWLDERGHTIPSAVEQKLHGYLQNFLRKEVYPEFYSRGMSSTVRAVALAALALRGRLQTSELERFRSHVENMDLFGKAHFLMAADALGVDASEVRDSILSHSNRSGGKFVFAESVDDGYKRILYSPERTQCAILSTLAHNSEAAPTGRGIGDVPFRLTRTITQTRGQRDHWENTQENVFCMNALIDYARVYEAEEPGYTLTTTFDGTTLGRTEFTDFRDAPVEHERAIQSDDPGRRSELRISKDGTGRVYYNARLFYSPKELKTESVNAGMEIHREYSVQRGGEWTLLSDPMQLRAGELVRVDLFLSLPTARNFVVVDDPVPGGLEPVNRDLATASEVDADEGTFQGSATSFWFTKDDWFRYGYSRWSFYHKELRHDAARFFSDYLPAGNYHLSYVAQAIAPGEFQVLPVHAEEMYDPDIFGQGVPATLRIESLP